MTMSAAKKYPRRIPRRGHTEEWDAAHAHKKPKKKFDFIKVKARIGGQDGGIVSAFFEKRRQGVGEVNGEIRKNGLKPGQKFELMCSALKLAKKVHGNAAQYSQNGQGQVVGEFLLLCSELEMHRAIGRITEKFDATLFGNEKWERVREILLELGRADVP